MSHESDTDLSKVQQDCVILSPEARSCWYIDEGYALRENEFNAAQTGYLILMNTKHYILLTQSNLTT
jgi:hypothetical protein